MAKDDWYNRESWSPEDEANFFAHLKRARTPYTKAHYLLNQALTLLSTDDLELVPIAILLSQKSLDDFPEERSTAAQCHLTIARAYDKLGKIQDASDAYMKCFEAQRKFPTYITGASTDFAMFVTRHKLVDSYACALEELKEYKRFHSFPIELFHHWGCLAIMAEDTGYIDEAKTFASFALEAAHKLHSGFWRHPTLGLVTDRDSEFYGRIERIEKKPVDMGLNGSTAKRIELDFTEKKLPQDSRVVADDEKCRLALSRIGMQVTTIYDLVNYKFDNSAAIPVLVQLLNQVETPRIKEGIVRALGVMKAKRIAEEPLIREFLEGAKTNESRFHLKWAIGNTLYSLGTIDLHFDAIAGIVCNEFHGTSRQMFVLLLGKSKKHADRAESIALKLLEDADVQGHAINALGRLRSVKAIKPIEKFLSSDNEWHRREARTALKKIQKSLAE